MNAETSLLLLSIFALFALPILCAVAYRMGKRHERKPWRKVRVSHQGRGPNADEFYWQSPPHDHGTGEKPAWFTDEQLIAAKVRASGLASHPHVYE